MTTKTMDWEEYIKKSDVKTIISRIENINIAVDSWEQIEELPTINLSAIDEMIEECERPWTYAQWQRGILQELKQRLSLKQ